MAVRIPWAPNRVPYQPDTAIPELILRGGQAVAAGHLRSGDIWGRTLADIGAGVGGAIMQHGEQRAAEKKAAQEAERRAMQDAAFVHTVETWDGKDPKALLSSVTKIYGAQEGMKAASAVLAFQSKTEKPEDDVKNLGTVLGFASTQSDDMMARWYPKLRERFAPTLGVIGIPPEALPEEWTPEARPQLTRLAQALAGGKGEEEYTLTPGAQRRRGAELVAENPAAPPKAPPAGSFEDYLNAPPERRAEIEAARKGYMQADDRPRDPLAQELAAIRVAEAKREAGIRDQIAKMPSEFRTGVERAGLSLPKARRDALNASAQRLWSEGKQDELKDVIRQAAIEGENVDVKNQVMGRQALLASLSDTRKILSELKEKGVPTGWLTGNVEDLVRKLGKTTNPEYVALANRLAGTLINYRRQATGVAFGEREQQQYERMFPNYRNDLPVNMALISGLEREARTYDRTYWEHKLGKEGARLMGVTMDETRPHLLIEEIK